MTLEQIEGFLKADRRRRKIEQREKARAAAMTFADQEAWRTFMRETDPDG